MISNMYQSGARYYGLDPRGIAIIQTQNDLYLWVGAEVLPANSAAYMAAAEENIALLQQYERAS